MNGPTSPESSSGNAMPADVLARVEQLQRALGGSYRDAIVEAIYSDAETIARRVTRVGESASYRWDQKIDRIVTSRIWGLPIMGLLLAVVFWVTIQGANVPSQMLATGLFWLGDQGVVLFERLGAPWWLTGFIWHGVYRGLAWVVSVMLPPMAIFFPIFTILEDLGYLPRVAFNVDALFKKAGAHGKQALTMSMGLGCNAAGVIACRIIDSPRERLIAILTNNFMPCNGRWPTLIMLATLFVAAAFPAGLAAIAAAGSLTLIVVIGIAMTLIVSSILSRTSLKGEASSFTLELPPYRRPDILRVLYTSLIDRTIFVLWRAIVMAVPAGGLIWLLSNIHTGGQSLTSWISNALDPLGQSVGLDGTILLAYIIAIPANEIVVPTIIMAYTQAGMMIELESMTELHTLFVDQQGWTLLTAVCLMLFSLLHNPCSTTIWTIYKETRSLRWALVSGLMPLAIAFVLLFVLTQTVHFIGGL
jgi:ferrous iron transport protein B